mgnify:FL=1|tara:strand:- start:137 stop:316 length:180 start_codon:yes stop_codon:yes gene_type:complete
MTSDPMRNKIDEEFIDQLNKHISHLIQDYIKKLVQHEVDVITDSDWFTEKIKDAVLDNS